MQEASGLFFGTSGPRDARICIVGEAWGAEEEYRKEPFVGGAGALLNDILAQAGIDRRECFVTNVISERPPNNEMWQFFVPAREAVDPPLRGLHPTPKVRSALERLYAQLRAVRPKIVLALGNYALWALTHCTQYDTPPEAQGRRTPVGITSWRGSMWYTDAIDEKFYLLPLIHPAAILRTWSLRAVTVHDLRARVPQALTDDWRPREEPSIQAPPSADDAIRTLDRWIASPTPITLANDVETSRGFMICVGFAESPRSAISIPLVRDASGEPYYEKDAEVEILLRVRKLLKSPHVNIVGQNYLYDIQYLQKELLVSRLHFFDTMLAHHLLFPGTPRGLDYLSSLYCRYHWYWKEDVKEWTLRGAIEDLLRYNAIDCLRTYECYLELDALLDKENLRNIWNEEREKEALALRMMNRGIRIDAARRGELALELSAAASDIAAWLLKILPQEIVNPEARTPWYQSAMQQREFFGNDLGLLLPRHRKTGRVTLGKEALRTLCTAHPEFSRIFEALEMFRSIRTFHENFVSAPLDPDGRMRCMFRTSGTETFRWSSSKNAFGRGTNLQNIPKGDED